MKFKDILNHDIVNLENCDQEPIHIPGSIQPHGFLAGFATDTWVIDFASENIADFIGLPYDTVLGKAFDQVFGAGNEEALREYLSRGLSLSSTPFSLYVNDNHFLCTVHESNGIYVLEGERNIAEEHSLPETYEQTRQFLAYMAETSSLKALCQSVAEGTRALTGYDRVMIYRFDEDYNGEVFAEALRDDLEPFLGLHYPHTDIPVQARQLYMKNLLRLISDINYIPVPIYTIDNKENKNLDLSLAVLRSTSPIHVQYLQNMGVGATLTISLIHKDRLWGLIACHHYSAKNLSHAARISAQLQGHFITSQIDLRQSNEEYDITKQTNKALEQLLSLTLSNTPRSYQDIVDHPQILNIANATGVCISIGDKLYTSGKLPGEGQTRVILSALAKHAKNASFVTEKILELLPDGKDYCDCAAGAIYHSLSISNNDCIVWFRPETIQEKNWAGEPAKAIIKDEKGLHPRKSFSLWQELVKCTSTPWQKPEINAAASYAHTLQKHVTFLSLTEEEEKYRQLSVVLQQSNDELENVNWISTHDLQEPLRKIQLMASRILDKNNSLAPKTHDMVTRMSDAAHRMQTLLKDIMAYSKVRNTESLFSAVNLTDEVTEARKQLYESINQSGVQIEVKDLPEIEGISFLVKQLFTNLISNSIKFSDLKRQQVITISSEIVTDAPEEGHAERQYHKVTLSDTGIGFEQKFAESIFKIFNRLHNREEYEGSGVGLALCKKIMQTHNGFIRAYSKPGEGAKFDMYFPVEQ